jgi:hypothetical protein
VQKCGNAAAHAVPAASAGAQVFGNPEIGMLKSIPEVNQMIAEGKPLLLAGSEEALSQLSTGNWIGGTIPYFMDEDGAVCRQPG